MKRRTSTAVNDTNGTLTNEQSERLNIWKEQFDTVPNKEPSVRLIEPHKMETRQNDREFQAGAFLQAEVENATKSTKSGMADGHDNVVAELLKAYVKGGTKEFTRLFDKVKEEGVASRSWNRGLMVKIPKKVTYVSVQIGVELHFYQS